MVRDYIARLWTKNNWSANEDQDRGGNIEFFFKGMTQMKKNAKNNME